MRVSRIFARFQFLSTPSARRATAQPVMANPYTAISIHALREEGDRSDRPCCSDYRDFYPRPPRGGRRSVPFRRGQPCQDISIHALREEGDIFITWSAESRPYFYPRPPRGGRLQTRRECYVCRIFLSTPSARRATLTFTYNEENVPDFYPRPPRGGRRIVLLPFLGSL